MIEVPVELGEQQLAGFRVCRLAATDLGRSSPAVVSATYVGGIDGGISGGVEGRAGVAILLAFAVIQTTACVIFEEVVNLIAVGFAQGCEALLIDVLVGTDDLFLLALLVTGGRGNLFEDTCSFFRQSTSTRFQRLARGVAVVLDDSFRFFDAFDAFDLLEILDTFQNVLELLELLVILEVAGWALPHDDLL